MELLERNAVGDVVPFYQNAKRLSVERLAAAVAAQVEIIIKEPKKNPDWINAVVEVGRLIVAESERPWFKDEVPPQLAMAPHTLVIQELRRHLQTRPDALLEAVNEYRKSRNATQSIEQRS